MDEGPSARRVRRGRRRGPGPFTLRLAAAFVVVAIGAVGLLAAATLVSARRTVGTLADERRAATRQQVTGALAKAYAETGNWLDADLSDAAAIASAAGATLTVVDASGDDIPVPAEPAPSPSPSASASASPSVSPSPSRSPSPGPVGPVTRPSDDPAGPGGPASEPRQSPGSGAGTGHGEPGGTRDTGAHSSWRALAVTVAMPASPQRAGLRENLEVVVDGQVVGRAVLLWPAGGLNRAESDLEEALTRNVVLGAGLATLLALLAAGFVASRVTRPLRRLTLAVDTIADGDRAARSTLVPAPGELGELAAAVDRMARDLDRHRRLRQALVADVAHELRTPLTILQGELEAAVDGVTTVTPASLASLHDEVLRLTRLVEDLDALADAEAAPLELRHETVDLAAVARTAVAGLTGRAEQHNVTLATRLSTVRVVGDPLRLGQVVTNLLTNALKFSPPGGTVDVEVRRERDEARCTVIDDGPGIPAEEIDHVFERFWRGRAAGQIRGTGVGLAVVAELTDAHGGRVEAANATGRGARLTVRLPVAPDDLHTTSTPPPRPEHRTTVRSV